MQHNGIPPHYLPANSYIYHLGSSSSSSSSVTRVDINTDYKQWLEVAIVPGDRLSQAPASGQIGSPEMVAEVIQSHFRRVFVNFDSLSDFLYLSLFLSFACGKRYALVLPKAKSR